MANDDTEVSSSDLVDTSFQRSSRQRRRRWSEAQKREIVAETLKPGASMSIIARRYDVNANQLFLWRRELLPKPAAVAGERMLPVEIVAVGLLFFAAGIGQRWWCWDLVRPSEFVLTCRRRRRRPHREGAGSSSRYTRQYRLSEGYA